MYSTYERKNIYKSADENTLKAIFDYSEGYKRFLDNGKTERETVEYTVEMLEKAGYKEYKLGDKINPHDKLYFNNRGKALFIVKAGSAEKIKEGVRILVAHVDSPRLDLKQVPLYEKSELAFLKTHYYGGIKKYQWLTIPLALHGVVVKADGTKINIKIGEKDTDPVFYITDLLPHLSQEQVKKTIGEGFDAENMNLVVGGLSLSGEDKDAVKKNVLSILMKEYGMSEEDFLSAELEVVPALKARDVGFDRAFVAGYGHDDRVCAYPEITATLDTATDRTVMTILADKEEIGSEGTSGMQCVIITDILDEIAKNFGVMPSVLRENSLCLSADVTAGYDPDFASCFEDNNASFVNKGVAMCKFTGARGKSGSNDASCEFVGYVRKLFNENGVIWQTAELGRVDLGGGGTVAKYIAKNNIETVDVGVPVLSMHAPYELISKADIYSAHLVFSAFIKD